MIDTSSVVKSVLSMPGTLALRSSVTLETCRVQGEGEQPGSEGLRLEQISNNNKNTKFTSGLDDPWLELHAEWGARARGGGTPLRERPGDLRSKQRLLLAARALCVCVDRLVPF